MANQLIERFNRIKAFVFDVDGVLTDGKLLLLEDGEMLRNTHVHDMLALQYAAQMRYKICIVSEMSSDAIGKWLDSMGINDIFFNLEKKLTAVDSFIMEYGISIDEIACMGDDVGDIEAMQLVGLAACPADAVAEVKAISHYVTQAKGGQGCVRELIEMVLRAQDRWITQEKK